MAITIEIIEKEPRDETRQIVYVLITVNGNEYELSIGNVPLELTEDSDIINWLKARKEKYREVIQNRIERDGKWTYKFPKWVRAIAEIDALPESDKLKAFLKKLVRYMGR